MGFVQLYPSFSSVGMKLENALSHDTILSHPSLRNAYVDRIIAARDKKRATSEPIAEWVRAALGEHAEILWPGFIYWTFDITGMI